MTDHDEDERSRKNARRRARYKSDPEVRAKAIAASLRRWASDPVYRDRMKTRKREKYKNDHEFREAEKARMREQRIAVAAAKFRQEVVEPMMKKHEKMHMLAAGIAEMWGAKRVEIRIEYTNGRSINFEGTRNDGEAEPEVTAANDRARDRGAGVGAPAGRAGQRADDRDAEVGGDDDRLVRAPGGADQEDPRP